MIVGLLRHAVAEDASESTGFQDDVRALTAEGDAKKTEGAAKKTVDMDALFKKKDANTDGKVSKEEFLKGQKDAAKAETQFTKKDKDKDGKHVWKISVNDFIIKACALALQAVPDANAVWAGDRILKLKPSDVAVAVAIEGGLFTPVLKDADKKSLSTLSTEMKDLATRAKTKKLAPHEYQGGSFAISNLGMMGVENFDAVINPPHGAILAVGAGLKKPVVKADGTLGVATVMSMTLSVDHRVIDGALGADLLKHIVSNLENPISMLA